MAQLTANKFSADTLSYIAAAKNVEIKVKQYCIYFLGFILLLINGAHAQDKIWTFGVLNQRSISLTAEYWNPILNYVSLTSGVPLRLVLAKTAPETDALIGHGQFDFIYSNTIYTTSNYSVGYQAFARPIGPTLQGQIVTLQDSPVRTLQDLAHREVGFPSLVAFTGYVLPMHALAQQGVTVKPIFAGNQEGIMAQLKFGRVLAAGVNSKVMREYAQRENIAYRVLWTSAPYLDLPIAAHPRVPKKIVAALRAAFLGMQHNAEGMKILQASAALIKQAPPLGYLPTDNREYQNYHDFFHANRLKAP